MALAPLSGWSNFYVITGSAAAGLTGLTFVVIALAAERRGVNAVGLTTFITPTAVHFATVLAISAFLCVPRQTLFSVGVGLWLVGGAGLVYAGIIAHSLHRKMRGYVPVKEDWIWYLILPAVAHVALCWMAWLIQDRPELAEYGIGAITLAFLFIGIHNAWDIAAYVSLRKHDDAAEERETGAAADSTRLSEPPSRS